MLPSTSTSTSTSTPSISTSTASAAQTLQSALRAYEKESLAELEALLPVAFVGRTLLLDAAKRSFNEQKQIRVNLIDLQIQNNSTNSSDSLTVINARWEKRFVRLTSQLPVLEAGTLSVVMRKSAGGWQIDSLSPDNPFTR